jgi:hypothetical protein
MIIMNMEGEGLADAKEFFRKKLVNEGVLKPTEEEAAAMAEAAANAPPDPNAVFVQAAAEKAMAEAESERADAGKKMAEIELTQAKTVETLSKVGGEPSGGQSAMTTVADDEKRLLEIEALRLENDMRRLKMAEMAMQVERGMAPIQD